MHKVFVCNEICVFRMESYATDVEDIQTVLKYLDTRSQKDCGLERYKD